MAKKTSIRGYRVKMKGDRHWTTSIEILTSVHLSKKELIEVLAVLEVDSELPEAEYKEKLVKEVEFLSTLKLRFTPLYNRS